MRPATPQSRPGRRPRATTATPSLPQLLAEGADGVQTEDDRLDSSPQAPDRLRDQHFGPGHLHDVEDEADADRIHTLVIIYRREQLDLSR